MKEAFLLGERVALRAAEPEDAPLFAACNNSPAARATFFTHTPVSLAREQSRLAGFYAPGADYIPLVICRREDGAAVGVTAFHRVDLVSRAAVYSICLPDSADWGKGYGGEVTRLMLHYAFDILNLHRVQLHVWTGNKAGARAYEKAGFRHEGLLREAMRHNGEWCDFHVMGILESEYRALRTQSAG